jgi:peptidoglycan-associated lipoprotein
MKSWTMACLAGVALLAACGSDTNANTNGTNGVNANTGPGHTGPNGPGRGTPGSQEDLVQTAGDKIFFDSDRSTLSDQARATLDKQAGWLQQNPNVQVWVAGNCDERGTEEYNLALGQRRANADKAYLMAHGVAATRVETISYGKARPVDPGTGTEAYAQNRNAITSVK